MKGGPQTWDEFKKPASINRACISLDGTRIAAVFADKTLCVYDTTIGEAISPPFKVDENLRSVIFSLDGKLVASGGHALRLWNVQTGKMVETFNINVYSLALSPDGACIAAGCGGRDIKGDGRGNYNIRIINLKLEKISSHLFIPSGWGGIKLLKGEAWPSPFEGHEGHVNSITYSADGSQIASSSFDGEVRVWDVKTGSRRTFKANSNRIYSVAFSPDGTQIVSDRSLFNQSTGSFTGHASGSTEKVVYSFSFSPDCRFLASMSFDGACQIYDTSTLKTIVQLVGRTGHVFSVALFLDGREVISASQSGTIRAWDVELPKKRGKTYYGRQMDSGVDGYWILGPDGGYLFWTPLPFQHTRNTLVLGKCMTIDLSNFVHGDEWWMCREPL